MPDDEKVDTWATLITDNEDSNQGGFSEPAPVTDSPPATPSVAVAPASTEKATDANVTTDPGKPGADATIASTETDPAKVEPPVTKPEGEGTVDPSKKEAATEEEEESAEDKAEFAGLPEPAQAPARRYRKESRQYKAFQQAIGGEDFLEDAKLLVPAFHTKPPEQFDEILFARSPERRNELYNHMVYTAMNGPDRPAVIKILAEKYRPEVEAALGVTATDKGEPAHTQESHVEPPANADLTKELATLDELLADQYLTAEQSAALQVSKAALLAKTKTETELADLRKRVDELAAGNGQNTAATAEQETGC